MTYFTKVFGCQMNQSDAERISTLFEKYKFKPAASIDAADFIIFVTCGVRQSAEDRVYGQVNNIRKRYTDKKIILTGCLAQRKDVQRRLKNKVNLYFSINDFETFENWVIENCLKIENLKLKIPAQKNCHSEMDYLSIKPSYSGTYSAYVPVMTGCDNFCSYCVVPYARGREYSRPAEDILREVKSLVKKGYKEIILLGQNVNSYKGEIPISKSQYPTKSQNQKFKILNTQYSIHNTNNKITINFSDLLKLINAIPGKFWITFLTSHPKDMSDELIETIARSKKICEYISLPAQAGDNEVLRRMNRKYTIKHYQNLIKKIRTTHKKYNLPPLPEGRCPEGTEGWEMPPAISTDIIVGFPGETKKQFENSVRLLREMKFDMAYIAQYSPRPETAAWKMKDNVSKKEKARREKVLTEILVKTALANNKKYIGKTVEVLVDASLPLRAQRSNPVELENTGSPRSLRSLAMTTYMGHTRTQKKVLFHSNKKIPIGSFQKVRITKAKAFGLEGEIK